MTCKKRVTDQLLLLDSLRCDGDPAGTAIDYAICRKRLILYSEMYKIVTRKRICKQSRWVKSLLDADYAHMKDVET